MSENNPSMICQCQYTVISTLGDPLASSVKLALDSRTKQNVAIKQIFIQRLFLGQIQLWPQLSNEHCVKVIDHFYDSAEQTLNIVMELCKGTLRDQIQQKPIYDQQHLLSFLVQITSAFLSMDNPKNPQNDNFKFRPENILIANNEGNYYKINVFGDFQYPHSHKFCAFADKEQTLKILEYVAPEICFNYHGQRTRDSANIWSLGVMLYEMIFWKLPLASEYRYQSQKRLQNYFRGEGESINFETIEGGPLKIIEVVKKMLAPLPTDRITWEELKNYLINTFSVSQYLFKDMKEVVPTFISATELLLKAIQRIRDMIQSSTHIFWKENKVFLQELRQIPIKYTYIICLKFNIGVSYKLPQLEDPQKRMQVTQLLEEVTKERLTCKNKIKEFEAKELDYLETLFADQLKVCREKLEAHRASMDPDMGLLYCLCGDLGEIFAKKCSPSPFDNIDYLSKSLKVKI